MEYITIWQPMVVIFISFSIGVCFGVLWLVYLGLNIQKELKKEIDAKNIALEKLKQTVELYTNKYEDNDYEAY